MTTPMKIAGAQLQQFQPGDVVGSAFLPAAATATNGQAALATTYAITADNVYQDTGLSVALPAAGTYLISANVRGVINVGGAGGLVKIQVFDTSAGAAPANSTRIVILDAPGTSVSRQLQAAYSWLVTAAAATTIKLQAQRVPIDGTTTWSFAQVGSDASGTTTLSYVRLA